MITTSDNFEYTLNAGHVWLSNTVDNSVVAFIKRHLKIRGVKKVEVEQHGHLFFIYTYVPYSRKIRGKVYEKEYDLLKYFPEFLFDFSCLA